MLLFGHIGITLGVFIVLCVFTHQIKTIIDPKYLVLGALFPDILDKPLGMVIFSSTLANGRIIGHTLILSISLLFIGLHLYDKRRDIRILSLASGSFFHLMEDQMWGNPRTLFWPLLGWSFPKNSVDRTGLEYLLVLFNRSFNFQLSESYVPEILGFGVVVILTLYWLKNELNKTNSKSIQCEYYEMPNTETDALYIAGFIIFGYIVVKAVIML